MKALLTNHRLLLALCCAAALFSMPSAMAQGLGLGLDVGGASVDVGVGGDSGVDLDVDLGPGDGGLGIELGGSGGGTGLDLAPSPDGLALGQEAALKAVRDRKALPLEDILLRAKLLTDGDIIDAQLIAVQDLLLYELKVLGKAGDVSELYFYARSGNPVETN
ncbi:MAG: hypothetical protein JWQ89_1138 [Devosia sp.]|uniref:PepSY domain-containing protein n=1 Tax=Devosia sp. TaxID=1871048 RepID=UPI0026240CBF|nr:hypothetical protein [Devosia sp.]MDB5539411.1 hypothetical protein [Devosia sp.]